MKRENRQWYWWDAKLANDGAHIFLAVQVECWPFPWGSLRWLFKAAGASNVIAEEGPAKGANQRGASQRGQSEYC